MGGEVMGEAFAICDVGIAKWLKRFQTSQTDHEQFEVACPEWIVFTLNQYTNLPAIGLRQTTINIYGSVPRSSRGRMLNKYRRGYDL